VVAAASALIDGSAPCRPCLESIFEPTAMRHWIAQSCCGGAATCKRGAARKQISKQISNEANTEGHAQHRAGGLEMLARHKRTGVSQ